jgi:peptide/nickel transport system substrate-binding protein
MASGVAEEDRVKISSHGSLEMTEFIESAGNSFWLPTRRALLKTSAAVAAGTALSSALPFSGAQAAGPKKGGTLRMGLEGGSASDSYDPTTYNDSIIIILALTVMNGLVEYDYAGQPTGELFESWEAKPGAKEWVFNVRQGITFSNGKTLDADDIIYSIQLHRAEASKSAVKGQLASLEEIKALSPKQVYMRLSEGNADLPVILGDYHLVVVPNGHTDWSNPIGTGAYVLESFEPGVRASFKSRGDYWKKGRGNFDAIEVRYITDSAARTAALQSGEIDVANRLDPRTVKLLMKSPDLNVVQTKGTGIRYCFVARVTDKPTDSHDIRMALKYGIDREQICKTVFGGFATPGNDHLLDAASPYYNSDMPQFAFDPDKAAFHFKKAGLANQAIDLNVSEGAWSSAADCAQIYQQNMGKAGIDLQIKKVAADGYWSNTWLKVPFCAVIWSRRMSADQTFSTTFGLKSDYNDSNWRSENFENLLSQARVELDAGARKIIYDECQQMIADEAGMVNFAIADFLDGYSKKVQGVQTHPRFDLDDYRVTDKAWFA